MNRETIEKALEPFFTTKPIGQGTGLGLSMTYGFARQSDGYAKIYSELDQATTIKRYLPRFYGKAEQHAAEHGEVILVVEDFMTGYAENAAINAAFSNSAWGC